MLPAAASHEDHASVMPDAPADHPAQRGETFDAAVIGAGVVGCAVARRLTLEGAKVVVIEKASDILDGASKGNSGILHTGFDAPPDSLEQRCIAAGYREYLEIRERLNLPLLACGALVLAWNEEEEARLPALMAQARANGVDDVAALSRAEILALEPNLSPRVRAGFRVPREYVIDPWSAPTAYLRQALENGAACRRGCEVLGGAFDGEAWDLETGGGPLRARAVVNCAGLYGDIVDRRLLGEASFTIRPRKGQFVVFDKAAASLAEAIILPVPTAKTKGVVICRTSFGNLLVGPTAEDQDSRDDASTDGATLKMLRDKGIEMLPALAGMPVTATYAGLRPASEDKDYQVKARAAQRYVTVGGIRSTGLSSALGLAREVHRLLVSFGDSYTPPQEAAWPRAGVLTDYAERAWARPDNGGIVCHCELVTRREIEAALDGPLAARSLAGLKRRTRATMGRCQGFYCLGALSQITEGCFEEPLAEDEGDAG
ncbi:NAD(P)/FAD-dependent oxidoreductase [Pelagibius sp. CAU 1746]|uniref:NAD(P)/FAD-dependent oxidoreductase n=1 Tax=Pelagibius sp. CAU 1746 TaxID=3140370 RepID=UPI00325A89F2